MIDRILEVAGLRFGCLLIEIAITISPGTSINGYGKKIARFDYWITQGGQS